MYKTVYLVMPINMSKAILVLSFQPINQQLIFKKKCWHPDQCLILNSK